MSEKLEDYSRRYRKLALNWNEFVAAVVAGYESKTFPGRPISGRSELGRFDFELFGRECYARLSHNLEMATVEYGVLRIGEGKSEKSMCSFAFDQHGFVDRHFNLADPAISARLHTEMLEKLADAVFSPPPTA